MKQIVSTKERILVPTAVMAFALGVTACGAHDATPADDMVHATQHESASTSPAQEAVTIKHNPSVTNESNSMHCIVTRADGGTWKVNFLESDLDRSNTSDSVSILGSAVVTSATGVKLTQANSAVARLWTAVKHPAKFATKNTDPFRAEHGYGPTFAIEQMDKPTALDVTVESAAKPACEVGQEVVDSSVTQELFPQGQ